MFYAQGAIVGERLKYYDWTEFETIDDAKAYIEDGSYSHGLILDYLPVEDDGIEYPGEKLKAVYFDYRWYFEFDADITWQDVLKGRKMQ